MTDLVRITGVLSPVWGMPPEESPAATRRRNNDAMSDLQAEVFPERVELVAIDDEPAATTIGAMASFSDRGLVLKVSDAGAVEAFPAGTRVRGRYGDHSGLCQFETEVASSSPGATTGDPGTIRLVPPARITTTQRRRYVRAEVSIAVAVALLDRKAMTFLSAPGDVDSLGGGGLKMIIAAHRSLVVGSQLALAIPLLGTEGVMVLGRVVQLLVPADGPATVRIGFTSIDPDDRERVERFAYRKVGGTAPAKLWAAGKIISTRPSPPDPEEAK